MDKFLKITEISEVKKDKNDNEYIVISAKPSKTLPNGIEVQNNFQPKSRTVFGPSTLKDGRKLPGDALYTDFKLGKLKVGSIVEGTLERFDTTPYEIDEKQVTSTTLVIFSNESPETVAKNALKGNKASILMNGIVIHEENLLNSTVNVQE